MGKRALSVALYSFMLVFYLGIVLYIFIEILHADTLSNFLAASIFEIIGFVFLAYFLISGLAVSPVKMGYFPSLLIVTIVYIVLLNVVNFTLISVVSGSFFILLNLILLFIYGLVAIPIYIMGRK